MSDLNDTPQFFEDSYFEEQRKEYGKSLRKKLESNLFKLTEKLGRIPTRDEFVSMTPHTKGEVVYAFGSYTDFKDHYSDQLNAVGQPTTTQSPNPSQKESASFKEGSSGNEATAQTTSDRIKTLDELLDECQVDRKKWKVKSFTVNKWEVGAKVDGEIIAKPLFQVKAMLERKNASNNLKAVLENWTPPTIEPRPFHIQGSDKKAYDQVFVPVLSDLHYGSASRQKYIYNAKKDWTTQDTVEAVDQFSESILRNLQRRNYKIQRCAILSLGDHLHSINGMTSRGTLLKYDCVREEQFDYAMSSLTRFIQNMLQYFPTVDIHSVYGNHAYEIEMALFRALKAYFTKEPRVVFHNYSTRPASVVIKNSLFLIDHGSDSEYRTGVPGPSQREKYIQSRFLQTPTDSKINSRYFVMGHLHHWEHIEYNDFELMLFGTTIGEDHFASASNWKNRPRQTSLVVDEKGVSEIIHTIF